MAPPPLCETFLVVSVLPDCMKRQYFYSRRKDKMALNLNMKTEAQFQTQFNAWLKSPHGYAWRLRTRVWTAAFELKLVVCKTPDRCAKVSSYARGYGQRAQEECATPLPHSKVSEGQVEALERVASRPGATEPLAYKISDMGMGYKPFDSFVMQGVPAFIVVAWQCGQHMPSRAYGIPISEWTRRLKRKARGSLSEAEAREVGDRLW